MRQKSELLLYMRYFSLLLSIIFIISCDSTVRQRDRHFLLGNVSLSENDADKAIDQYDLSIKIDKNFAPAYNNRGVAKAKKNWHSEAIQDFNEAIKINPAYYECMANRAFSYEKVNKLEKAIQDYNQLINQFPDSSKFYLALGSVEVAMKDFDKALLTFSKAKELSASSPEFAEINLANTYYFKGDFRQAFDQIAPLLNRDKTNSYANNTAALIKISLGEFNEAIVYSKLAVKQTPGNGVFSNNLGYCYLKLGELDSAINYINLSIRQDPQNAWSFRNKGLYYYQINDETLARKYLNTAKEMNPLVDSIDYYLQKIEL